ncbi:probable beta-D-xylosidase 5 [Jatropha curcas]|nr:probable beta-D-xylosidase 5 [Jatropha curcas]
MDKSLSSLLIIHLISIALFAISTTARKGQQMPSSYFTSDATPAGSNFTYVCDPSRYTALKLNVSDFVFCDKSLPYVVRAKDLVNRMTLQEKVQQLGDLAYGVPRLGLPKYEWWSEALHGVSNLGPGTFFDDLVPGATSFPTVILTTASFNESLWRTIGQAVSTEARAMYNLGRAGLTFWSPTINVARDPRWGRITETPGEDPFIVGRYASNYVRGLQDVEGTENYPDLNSRPLKVSSCCKHFAAYDLDNWQGIERYSFNAIVTEQDMVETFLRPFEMCVKEGDASSVMCSYNRVNGIPTCADPKLLNQTIRGVWNLHGYIVSDCDSIEVMVNDHKFLGDTKEDAVARTLKAGLDLDCGVYYTQNTESSVNQGKVRGEDIDRSLKYLYVVLLRLGYFDGSLQFQSLGKKDVCSEEHIELAAEAAREGIVLLKNEDNTLPLNSNKVKTLAVVGPHANATTAMIGNYAGIPCRYISPIDGFSTYANVSYEIGCDVACKNQSLIFPALQVAKEADATIIVAGLDLSIEAEGLDRKDLLFPGNQTELINQVAELAKGPVILVIMSAGGIDITSAKNNKNVTAILWAGYPGEEGGRAIADIVFGKQNPGGRLPVTWYEANYVNQLPMTSLKLRPDDKLSYPGRTYKFFNGSTVYPFGYGLSYTTFSYKLTSPTTSVDIKLNKFQHCHDLAYKEGTSKPQCPSVQTNFLSCNRSFHFDVEVTNVGSRSGSEVIIVYSMPPKGIAGANIKQVIGFKRLFVKAKRSQNVTFEFDVCKSLQIIDYSAYSVLPLGNHTILIGDTVSFPIQISFS